MKKFILITGMGHSGTRHPVSVLQRHPQVFVPQKKLNGVTIYRDGIRFPILSVDSQLTSFQKYKDKKFLPGKAINIGINQEFYGFSFNFE